MTANPRLEGRESTHDPLCLLPTSCEQYPHGHPRDPDGWLFYCDDCEIDCICDVIAKVRADERERAAQRVEYLIKDNEYVADGVPVIYHWLIALAAKVCRQGEWL